MALNKVKQQVLLMLKSVLTLDSTEQTEAIGFLQDCVNNFGLSLPTNLTSSEALRNNTEDVSEKGFDQNVLKLKGEDVISKSGCVESTFQNVTANCHTSTQPLSISNDTIKESKPEENTFEKPINVAKAKKVGKKVSNVKKCNKTLVSEMDSGDFDARFASTNTNNTDSNAHLLSAEDVECGEKMSNPCAEDTIGSGKQKKDSELYKCPGCLKLFQNKGSLLLHLKCYTDAPMSCKNCRNCFPNILHFWEHQKNGKCKVDKLQCNECDVKFKHRRHYLKHILGHKDNNCRYCDDKFSTWTQYKNHLKEKHPDIKMERDLIPCKFCPMSFHRHIGLYNHYRVKHSKGKFVCLSCGLLLPTKEKHKEHTLVHESEKNWKCKICKMKFYRRQQLLLHVSIHKLGIYKCLTCDITVTSKTDLQKHKKEGHEVRGLERKYECDICHKTFAKRFTLNNHVATHSKEKCFTCKYCIKSFRTLDSLNRHQKRKSHFEKAKIIIPESKYEKVYEDKLICEKCGKQYKTQRELKCHLIVHKNIYDCNECGKTFTLKFNLTKHLRLHRKAIRVVCELCGDTFNQLSALNEHCIMKHSDARKAKCETCGKAFKRKSELNRHFRTHEYKRPFACFCGKAYKQSAHLKNHYKSAHGNSREVPLVDTPMEEFQSNPSAEMFRGSIPEKMKKECMTGGEHGPLIETPIENFPSNQAAAELYRDSIVDKMKKEFIGGEHAPLVPLENIPSEPVFRSSPASSFIEMQMNANQDTKVNYVSNYGMRYAQSEMEPINVNYDDLNFPSTQPDKRGLVFPSPAVNLSMVAIPEVVQNGIELDDGHRTVEESVESFNKISDDSSQIQLLNLSEHIVQEYLLNLQ